MMPRDEILSVIDTIRNAHRDAIHQGINDFDFTNNDFPEKQTIILDRWILNDLNVLLQNYRKEIIKNDIQ